VPALLKFQSGERERDAVKRSVCLRGHKVLKSWSALAAAFNPNQVDQLYEALNEFAESADAFGLVEVSEPALNFAIYLSSFVDGLQPAEKQLKQLAALADKLDAALKTAEPEAVPLANLAQGESASALKSIYYLRLSDELAPNLCLQLASRGYEITHFLDPKELTQQIRRKRAHALIADARYLPHLMGLLELAEDADGSAAPRMPCIVLSDSADLGRQLHAVRAGADAFFAEPFDLGDIERKLTDLILEEAAPATHVLIVEDDRSQALFADVILRQRGMTTRLAFHANDALLALKERKPDVILSDVNMPDVNGFELAQMIRQQPGFLDVPIVFLSGEAESDERVKSIRRAGDDFLSKPARPRALLAAVQTRVKRARELAALTKRGDQRDGLTGLYALSRFLRDLSERIRRSSATTAVLYVLVDQAEALAVELGPTAAQEFDRALAQAFAEQLGERAMGAQIRDFCYVARVERDDAEALFEVAQAIRLSIAQTPFRINKTPRKVTLSIGLRLLEGNTASPEAEVSRAQAACMGARAGGGNRVVRHSLDDLALSDGDLEQTARDVLSQGIKSTQREIRLEPMALMLGNVRGQYSVEMKLKRSSESAQLIDKEVYLPIADELKRRREVDQVLTEMAANVIKTEAREDMNLRFFLSVGLANLLDANFETWLTGLTRILAIKTASLCLMVSVGPAMDRLDLLRARLERIKQKGFRLCLDEFGRDRVAVHLVDQLPVDCVRLSADLAPTMCANPRVFELVGALIERARAHHKTVIVPGVADAATLAALWQLQPDYVQGSLIAAPRAKPDFDFPEALE